MEFLFILKMDSVGLYAILLPNWRTEKERKGIDSLRWLCPLPLHIQLLTGHTHRSTSVGLNNIWAIIIPPDHYISEYAQQRHVFFLGFLSFSSFFSRKNMHGQVSHHDNHVSKPAKKIQPCQLYSLIIVLIFSNWTYAYYVKFPLSQTII